MDEASKVSCLNKSLLKYIHHIEYIRSSIGSINFYLLSEVSSYFEHCLAHFAFSSLLMNLCISWMTPLTSIPFLDAARTASLKGNMRTKLPTRGNGRLSLSERKYRGIDGFSAYSPFELNQKLDRTGSQSELLGRNSLFLANGFDCRGFFGMFSLSRICDVNVFLGYALPLLPNTEASLGICIRDGDGEADADLHSLPQVKKFNESFD